MVDIHCHILPGIDDGAKDWDTSLEMCRIAAEDGITHIVATPHANDEYMYDRVRFRALLDELRARVPHLSFSLGCDFHFSYDNLHALAKTPDDFLIEGTRYLLVEFSDYVIPPSTMDQLHGLLQDGITPIITHPERNRILSVRPDAVCAMADMGCIIQVTANSLTGFWGKQVQRSAEKLLETGCITVLATDAHETKRRLPKLSEARKMVEQLAGKQLAQSLVNDSPSRIVAGEPIRP